MYRPKSDVVFVPLLGGRGGTAERRSKTLPLTMMMGGPSSGIECPEKGTCMVPGTTATNQELTGMLAYVTLFLCEGTV